MPRWKEKLGLGSKLSKVKDAQSNPEQRHTLPQVHLEPLFTPKAETNAGTVKSQAKLQKALEDLESVLQAQDKPSSQLPGLEACLQQTGTSQRPFRDIATAVQEGQESRNQASMSRAGSFMQKLYPISKLALNLTGTLTSYAGYAPVQIATNGLSQVFELAMNVPKQSDEVISGLESIAADEHLLVELQRLPLDVVDETVVVSAIELQTQLADFLRKGLLWLNKNFFVKFGNSLIDPTQMADARASLKNAHEALKGAISSDTYLTVKWQQIAMIEAETLNILCANDYHAAQLMKQKELHSCSLSNSGEWAVTDDKFIKWRDGNGGILWCPGLPGAGKTYMVSRVIDHLEIVFRGKDDIGLAYVYCEYQRSNRQSEKSTLEALTRQLIARKSDLCFEFQQQLKDPLSTTEDRKELLRQVLRRFNDSFILLDALDEFSPGYVERHSFACLLKELVEDCSDNKVRLCITSREAEGIWQALCSADIPTERFEVRSSEQDIRRLVESTYDKAAAAIAWMKNNASLRQLAVTKVVDKSDRIFKLADLQIKSVLRKPSAKAMKKALEELTTDVNEYYREAMQRIASQTDSSPVVFNLLTWLTFVRSPIHLHELELAVSIPPGEALEEDMDDQIIDIPRYVGLSEGLVSVVSLNTKESLRYAGDVGAVYDAAVSKGPEVVLAHQSIRDYLWTASEWIRRDGDALILHACLTTMASRIFKAHLLRIWQELRVRQELPGRAVGSGKVDVPFEGSRYNVPEFLFWSLSAWGQYLTPESLTAEIKPRLLEVHEISSSHTENWKNDPTSVMGPAPWEYESEGTDPDYTSQPDDASQLDDTSQADDTSQPDDISQPEGDSQLDGSSVLSGKVSSTARSTRSSPAAGSEDRSPPHPRSRSRSRCNSHSTTRSLRRSTTRDIPSLGSFTIEWSRPRTHRRYSSFLERYTRSFSPYASPLYWCALQGWTQGCRVLLPLENDPNVLYEVDVDKGGARGYKETALSAAVISGDLATVKVFLDDTRVDPDIGKLHYAQGHVTPLMSACKSGNKEITRLLLARDEVDVNSYDNGGYGTGLTPILQARSGIIALLLERDDLDVNMLILGRRPIHHLVNIGGPEAELILLLSNPKTNINARTAITIWNGNKYVDPRDMDCFAHSRTALMVAAFVGHAAQTKVLLNHRDIDLQLRDDRGMTALMLAATGYTRQIGNFGGWVTEAKDIELQHSVQRHSDTVRLLVNAPSVEINAQDGKGRPALALAAMCGLDPEFEIDRDVPTTSNALEEYRSWYEKITSEVMKSKHHHVDIIRALLEAPGIDVNLTDESGYTPLDYTNWSQSLVVQERDWEVQELEKCIERCKEEEMGLAPASTVEEIHNRAENALESLIKVCDLLVAARARVGKTIDVPVIPDNRTASGYELRWVAPSESDSFELDDSSTGQAG